MKALLPDKLSPLHSRCMRCNRVLTNLVSRTIGYGTKCAALAGGSSPQGGLFSGQAVAPKHWPEGSVRLPASRMKAGASIPVYSGVHIGADTLVTVATGNNSRPLDHIVYHSPTGMSWGYGGSGPADLARSILADFAGLAVADTFYQEFKRSFIAGLPETWKLSGTDIYGWLKERIAK